MRALKVVIGFIANFAHVKKLSTANLSGKPNISTSQGWIIINLGFLVVVAHVGGEHRSNLVMAALVIVFWPFGSPGMTNGRKPSWRRHCRNWMPRCSELCTL